MTPNQNLIANVFIYLSPERGGFCRQIMHLLYWLGVQSRPFLLWKKIKSKI